MFNPTLSMLHNLIFHLVAVERDAEFQIQVIRASSPNDRARTLLNVKTSMTEENQRVFAVILFGGANVCKEMELPATKIALSALKQLEDKADVHIEDFVSRVKAVHEALWRELPQQYIHCYPREKFRVFTSLNSEEWSSIFKKIPALESDIRAGIHCWTFGQNELHPVPKTPS